MFLQQLSKENEVIPVQTLETKENFTRAQMRFIDQNLDEHLRLLSVLTDYLWIKSPSVV